MTIEDLKLVQRAEFWARYHDVIITYKLLPKDCIKFPPKSIKVEDWSTSINFLNEVIAPILDRAIEYHNDPDEQAYNIMMGIANSDVLVNIKANLKSAWQERKSKAVSEVQNA